jgi:8-oxo-dGTP pyrophosphatase MutT (NUDIX family)
LATRIGSKTVVPKNTRPKNTEPKNTEPKTIDPKKKRIRNAFQIAALVYREHAHELEILLVTSRETRRWILPKGWPVSGKTAAATAEQEADEEAGILGHAGKKPLGRYAAIKQIGEISLACEVEVYPLHFAKQKQKWKERGERLCRWLPAEEAATTIAEPDLASIIRGFAEEMRPQPAKISRSA